MSRTHRVGHNVLMVVICPSVCSVPDPKSRTEGYRKLKIGRKEDDDKGEETTWNKWQTLKDRKYVFISLYLQGAGAYCGSPTTGRTDCLTFSAIAIIVL